MSDIKTEPSIEAASELALKVVNQDKMEKIIDKIEDMIVGENFGDIKYILEQILMRISLQICTAAPDHKNVIVKQLIKACKDGIKSE